MTTRLRGLRPDEKSKFLSQGSLEGGEVVLSPSHRGRVRYVNKKWRIYFEKIMLLVRDTRCTITCLSRLRTREMKPQPKSLGQRSSHCNKASTISKKNAIYVQSTAKVPGLCVFIAIKTLEFWYCFMVD